MVAVWRCGQHARMNSVQHNTVWKRITRLMRTGFTLNPLWAIRLLNRFESGFSVNRPLVSSRSASAYILAHWAGLDGQTLLENSIH